MKILIGYDGSVCADAALFDLTRAGLPEEAEPACCRRSRSFFSREKGGEAFEKYLPRPKNRKFSEILKWW